MNNIMNKINFLSGSSGLIIFGIGILTHLVIQKQINSNKYNINEQVYNTSEQTSISDLEKNDFNPHKNINVEPETIDLSSQNNFTELKCETHIQNIILRDEDKVNEESSNNIVDDTKLENKKESEENKNSISLLRTKTKTKSEIEFESENPNEKIIKIICDDEDRICYKLEREINKQISQTKNKDLNIIIETQGANICIGLSICNHLYIYKKLNPENKVKIYVPKYAYSCGTIIGLMADELYLNDYAFLSPVDVQLNLNIETYSSNDYIAYSEHEDGKTIGLENNSLIMSILAKKYDNISQTIFNKFVFNNCEKYTPKTRKRIVNKFLHTEYPHIMIFDSDDIQSVGIEVKGVVPENIMSIYKDTLKIVK